jgi:hypothetical protein
MIIPNSSSWDAHLRGLFFTLSIRVLEQVRMGLELSQSSQRGHNHTQNPV